MKSKASCKGALLKDSDSSISLLERLQPFLQSMLLALSFEDLFLPRRCIAQFRGPTALYISGVQALNVGSLQPKTSVLGECAELASLDSFVDRPFAALEHFSCALNGDERL